MVFYKLYKGVATIDPNHQFYDLQGQGFGREDAAKVHKVVSRRTLGLWGPALALGVSIPLSKKLKMIIMKRFNPNPNHFFNTKRFHFLVMGSKLCLFFGF